MVTHEYVVMCHNARGAIGGALTSAGDDAILRCVTIRVSTCASDVAVEAGAAGIVGGRCAGPRGPRDGERPRRHRPASSSEEAAMSEEAESRGRTPACASCVAQPANSHDWLDTHPVGLPDGPSGQSRCRNERSPSVCVKTNDCVESHATSCLANRRNGLTTRPIYHMTTLLEMTDRLDKRPVPLWKRRRITLEVSRTVHPIRLAPDAATMCDQPSGPVTGTSSGIATEHSGTMADNPLNRPTDRPFTRQAVRPPNRRAMAGASRRCKRCGLHRF